MKEWTKTPPISPIDICNFFLVPYVKRWELAARYIIQIEIPPPRSVRIMHPILKSFFTKSNLPSCYSCEKKLLHFPSKNMNNVYYYLYTLYRELLCNRLEYLMRGVWTKPKIHRETEGRVFCGVRETRNAAVRRKAHEFSQFICNSAISTPRPSYHWRCSCVQVPLLTVYRG